MVCVAKQTLIASLCFLWEKWLRFRSDKWQQFWTKMSTAWVLRCTWAEKQNPIFFLLFLIVYVCYDSAGLQGDFDDAQAIVKAAFADKSFREEVKLGAINSINWARVLAQITYYFYSWLRVTDGQAEPQHLNYAVPTGNFGDILAGFYAKKMGLPIDQLVYRYIHLSSQGHVLL